MGGGACWCWWCVKRAAISWAECEGESADRGRGESTLASGPTPSACNRSWSSMRCGRVSWARTDGCPAATRLEAPKKSRISVLFSDANLVSTILSAAGSTSALCALNASSLGKKVFVCCRGRFGARRALGALRMGWPNQVSFSSGAGGACDLLLDWCRGLGLRRGAVGAANAEAGSRV